MKRVKKLVVYAILIVTIVTCFVISPKSAEAKSVISRNDTYTQLYNPWSSYTSFDYRYKIVNDNVYLKDRSYGNLGSKWWNWKYLSHYRWWWNY